jgi:colicin import membrane protein
MTSDLELFASFVRSEEQKERDAKKAARDQRRQADERNQLVKAKEDAAALVKRLRGSDRATAEQKAEADAAYKAALAAVVAAETGEAPAWAPPPTEESAESAAADEADEADAAQEGAEAQDEAAEVDEADAAAEPGADAAPGAEADGQ